MKNALRKGSATSDEDSIVRHGRDDDDTDTEHHDSLPLDEDGKDNRLSLSKFQQIRKTRKPSLVDIVQIAKYERDRERAAAMAGTNNVNGTRPRPKIDKQERKDRDNKPELNNDHDPEVNTRIVNERRQSLLRRKREEDEENIEPKYADSQVACEELQRPLDSSHYAVIDEKKQKHVKNSKNNNDEEEFKINAKKYKNIKPTTSTTPSEKKKEERTKYGSENEQILEVSETIDLSMPTTPTPSVDKFSNFSKLGRKKFSNFLALVRDAVIANKSESDLPAALAAVGAGKVEGVEEHGEYHEKEQQNVNTNIKTISATVTSTAIDIPVESEENKPENVTVTVTDNIDNEESKIQNNLEEVDLPGPIIFSNNNNNNNASQRRKAMERASPIRQDSKSSVWSDNIPTIMISMGSEECIVQSENIPDVSLEYEIIAPKIDNSPIVVTPTPTPTLTSPPPPTTTTTMTTMTTTSITPEASIVTSMQSSTPAGAVINIIKVELEDTE